LPLLSAVGLSQLQSETIIAKENSMNIREIGLALALAIGSVCLSGADSNIVGTWKQNLEKSKYNPGPAPTIPATIRIESVDGGEKLSVDGVGSDGRAASWSYTASYDGKPTSVTGSPYGDMASLKRIDSHTSQITYTKNGKVTRTSKRTLSKDGKTLMIAAKGTNAKGQDYNNVTVFEKQ
jgi:hypothetical protein